jgi:non-ribosomal peptide synthetase component F
MPTVSIPRALRQNALRSPDAVALVCGDRELTWTQLDQRSNRLARDYAARGVGYGDFVTIALANGPERVFEVYGGTERIGGTLISGGEWLEHPGSVGRPTGGRRIPRSFEYVEGPLRDESGKLRRTALRAARLPKS